MRSEVERTLEELLRRNLRIETDPAVLSEMLDRIIRRRGKISTSQAERLAGNFIKGFYEFQHPLFRKTINWGNVGRSARGQLKKEVAGLIVKACRGKEITPQDILNLRRRVQAFRDEVIRDIMKEVSAAGKGLRQYHVPGSVALSEARNVYYGEEFEKEQLLSLAERFLRSICVGNWVAVYFEKNALSRIQDDLRHLVMERFPEGRGHVPPNALGSLEISVIESDRAYIVFSKFLLWLYRNYDAERDPERRRLLEQIINDVRDSTGILYLMPRNKSEYMLIAIPSLNIFTATWLEDRERRRVLESFSERTYRFIVRVLRAARGGERRKAENELKILANSLELFYRDLVETGSIGYQPLRGVVDQIVYLSQRYRVPHSFSYMKRLLV